MAESSTGVTNQPVDLHEDASMKTDTMSSPSVNGYMPDPHGTNGVNGHSTDIDVNMNGSLETIVAAEPTPSPMRRSADMSIDEPPAKRARKMSDDDQAPATFANVSQFLPLYAVAGVLTSLLYLSSSNHLF
jgi:hypothetical protein